MEFLKSIWFFVNILLVVLILLRSPNEQSLQKTFGRLKLFDSSKSLQKNIDFLISIFIFLYFLLGLLLSSKTFS